MSRAQRFIRLFGLPLLAAIAVACGSEGGPTDPTCEGDSCDETPFKPKCAQLVDRSGRNFLPSSIKNDALVKFIYDGDGSCTVKADEIAQQLKRKLAGGKCNLQTRIISETDTLAKGDAQDHRAVTTLSCGGTPSAQVLISTFGFDPTGKNVPGGVEVIVFHEEESEGVFNYYKDVGGKMAFFGSSKDYIQKGPGGPNLTDIRGCANCHPDGGLVMKEMMSPWLHWEPSSKFGDSPGPTHFANIIKNRESWMGTQAGGADLEESNIEPANKVWNKTRVDILAKQGDLKELLRPLFCPVTINIGSSFDTGTLNSIRAEMLFAPGIARYGFGSDGLSNLGALDGAQGIQIQSADYNAIRDSIGQRVGSVGANDTHFTAVFPHPGHQDANYIDQLIGRKIIDQQLARDILMVDFTRPMSTDRCNLLASLEGVKIEAKDQNPVAIRDAILGKLGGQSDGAAGQLVAHLEASKANASFDHNKKVTDFVAACNTRNGSEKVAAGGAQVSAFLADVIKLVSLRKKTFAEFGGAGGRESEVGLVGPVGRPHIGPQPVFEFADTLAMDSISVQGGASATALNSIDPEARLSPIDCKLVNQFTPVPK